MTGSDVLTLGIGIGETVDCARLCGVREPAGLGIERQKTKAGSDMSTDVQYYGPGGGRDAVRRWPSPGSGWGQLRGFWI
jgi:hypothetical protein